MELQKAIEILNNGDHTLVVSQGNTIYTFNQRGIADLYRILTESPEILRGACIADKVVGKGAAALMILGGVGKLHTRVISSNALNLFSGTDVYVRYDAVVPHIVNRTGSGWCPVESLCKDCSTPEACFIEIRDKFIPRLKN